MTLALSLWGIVCISHLHKYSDPLLSTFLKHLWKLLQPRLLRYEVTSLAHLYLGSFSHCSLQILSSSVRLHSNFEVSPKLLGWIHVRVLAEPLKDIQRLVPKPLRCLGSVLRVVVLLDCDPSTQSEVLRALEQVFIKDCFFFCPVHLSLNPDKSPCPCR